MRTHACTRIRTHARAHTHTRILKLISTHTERTLTAVISQSLELESQPLSNTVQDLSSSTQRQAARISTPLVPPPPSPLAHSVQNLCPAGQDTCHEQKDIQHMWSHYLLGRASHTSLSLSLSALSVLEYMSTLRDSRVSSSTGRQPAHVATPLARSEHLSLSPCPLLLPRRPRSPPPPPPPCAPLSFCVQSLRMYMSTP